MNRRLLASSVYFWGVIIGIAGCIFAWILATWLGWQDAQPIRGISSDFIVPAAQFYQKKKTLFILIWGCTAWALGSAWGLTPYARRILAMIGLSRTQAVLSWFTLMMGLLAIFASKETSYINLDDLTVSGVPPFDAFIRAAQSGIGPLLLIVFAWMAALTMLASQIKKTQWETPSISKLLAIAAAAVALYFAAKFCFIADPPALGVSSAEVHLDPLEDAVWAAMSGGWVYRDFLSQYGGFAQIASYLTGATAFEKLSLEMFLSLAASCLLLFGTVKRATSSSAWGLVAMTAAVGLANLPRTEYIYFQGASLRWLFPCALLFMASFDTKRASVAFAFLIPLSLFWNPETGLACTASWLGWLIWSTLLTRKKGCPWGRSMKSIGLQASAVAFGCVASLGIYALFTGGLPNLDTALYYTKVFGSLGFMNLPTTPLHWWWLTPIASALALAYSARMHVTNLAASRILSMAALLGLALLPYYMGRSVAGNLFSVMYPEILIAAILTHESSQRVLAVQGYKPKANVIACFLSMILLAGLSASALTDQIILVQRTPADETSNEKDNLALTLFFKSHQFVSSQKTVFFTARTRRVAHLAPLVSVPILPPPHVLITKSQAFLWMRAIAQADVVYVDMSLACYEELPPGNYDWKSPVLALVSKDFEYVDSMTISKGTVGFFLYQRKPKPGAVTAPKSKKFINVVGTLLDIEDPDFLVRANQTCKASKKLKP